MWVFLYGINPETIVTSSSKPDFNRKRNTFGIYAIIYTGTGNNMNSRRVPVISLKESNDMNGQYVMSLYTGKRLQSKDWDQIPIDEFAIDKVKKLTTNEDQSVIQNKCPLFEQGAGNKVEGINIKDNSNTI